MGTCKNDSSQELLLYGRGALDRISAGNLTIARAGAPDLAPLTRVSAGRPLHALTYTHTEPHNEMTSDSDVRTFLYYNRAGAIAAHQSLRVCAVYVYSSAAGLSRASRIRDDNYIRN